MKVLIHKTMTEILSSNKQSVASLDVTKKHMTPESPDWVKHANFAYEPCKSSHEQGLRALTNSFATPIQTVDHSYSLLTFNIETSKKHFLAYFRYSFYHHG